MRVRDLRTSSFFCLPLLFLSQLALAQQSHDPCLEDEKCNGLYEAGLALSKAGQFRAALSNYEQAYARRPVPWLYINIGRVQQKMGQPKAAIESYQRYLAAPAGQQEPEAALTARQFLKQAEDDLAHPKAPSVIVLKEERGPRPLWRMLLGAGLLAGGAGLLIPGAYDLGIDGQCVDQPVAPLQVCPTVYAGSAVGAPLLAVGALAIVGGVVTIALPGPMVRRQVSAAAPPPAP